MHGYLVRNDASTISNVSLKVNLMLNVDGQSRVQCYICSYCIITNANANSLNCHVDDDAHMIKEYGS